MKVKTLLLRTVNVMKCYKTLGIFNSINGKYKFPNAVLLT